MTGSMRLPKLVLLIAVAAAMALVSATQARADASVSVSYDGHIRGLATFIADGDWMRICDRRQDGLPVIVRFSYIRKNGSRQTGSHIHTQGVDGAGNAGPEGARKGCSYGNHNFGEHRSVWLQACVRHGGGALTCSKTTKTTA
jgi:hypothetical protein